MNLNRIKTVANEQNTLAGNIRFDPDTWYVLYIRVHTGITSTAGEAGTVVGLPENVRDAPYDTKARTLIMAV